MNMCITFHVLKNPKEAGYMVGFTFHHKDGYVFGQGHGPLSRSNFNQGD